MLDTDRLDRSPVVSMSNSAGNEYDTTKTVFQNIQKVCLLKHLLVHLLVHSLTSYL
jgi:hypothetical protein